MLVGKRIVAACLLAVCFNHCLTGAAAQSGSEDCPEDCTKCNGTLCTTCLISHFERSGRCVPCHSSCATCQGSSEKCTSCPADLYLDGETCVDCKEKYKLRSGAAVRLVNGKGPLEGRVEVYNSKWGAVCDNSWSMEDADVVCRQLRYGRAVDFFTGSHFGGGALDIIVDNVTCTGNESLLQTCASPPLGKNNCPREKTAGVRCSGPDSSRRCFWTCPEGYLLTSDFTVCDPCDFSCETCSSNPTECRSCPRADLAYLQRGKCLAQCGTRFFNDSFVCYICHNLCERCTGPKSTDCIDCPAGHFLVNNTCTKTCSGSSYQRHTPPFDVRLRPGVNKLSGRLEVRHPKTGVFGTVCDDKFSWADASVACLQLGHGPPETFYNEHNRSSYGGGDVEQLEIFLDDVRCGGNESSLFECRHRGIGTHNCQHGEDVWLECSFVVRPKTCMDVCNATEGYQTVKPEQRICQKCGYGCKECVDDNGWRCTKCYTDFFFSSITSRDCTMTCREGFYGNTGSGRRCLPCNSKCDGCYDGDNDAICMRCNSRTDKLNGTSCLARCSSADPDKPLLPLDETFNGTRDEVREQSGMLELKTDGAWHPVRVDVAWNLQSAKVACRQMRRQLHGELYELVARDDGETAVSVDCTGSETSLSQCELKRRRDEFKRAVRLTCTKPVDSKSSQSCTAVSKEDCSPGVCEGEASCFSYAGQVYKSACYSCPSGTVGDGRNCSTSSVIPHAIIVKPESKEVDASTPVTLKCRANATTVINWYHQNKTHMTRLELIPGHTPEDPKSRYSMSASGDLTINNTEPSMVGVYHCISRTTLMEVNASAYVSLINKTCTGVCDVNTSCGVFHEFGEETDSCCPSCRIRMSAPRCGNYKCFPVRNCVRYVEKHKERECCLSCAKKVANRGRGPCSYISCPTGSICNRVGGKSVCQCNTCKTSYETVPALGWDGKSYASKCHLQSEACKYRVYLGQ